MYEVLALTQGKRETSTLIGIGTPGPNPHDSVLSDMRDYARANPEDTSFVWREHSAAGLFDHPIDCQHCWTLANFLHRDAITALMPPKLREATFRHVRLSQFVTAQEGAFLPEGIWDPLNIGEDIVDGSELILALDSSLHADATGVLVATVSARLHVDVVGLWEPPKDDTRYRVPVGDVENTIREACQCGRVLKVDALSSPFRGVVVLGPHRELHPLGPRRLIP